jgi:two-component system KDP operon response regulator KdpE
MKPVCILLVEDDVKIQKLLRSQLTARQYQVEVAGDGLEAVTMLPDLQPDLVLLDITLPGMDGLEVCREIREWSAVPIILLTGKDSPQFKVTALELGADDYVTKPFHMGELAARIQAVLRRTQNHSPTAPTEVVIDDLTIDLAARQVRRGEQSIHLTKIEFDLLHTLVTASDKMLSHQYLLEAVWGPGSEDVRPVHVHICNLRRKIETSGPDKIRRIISVPGVGYRFRLRE